MKPVFVVAALAFVFAVAACNPAARCSSAADCSTGVCSGGFCTDVAAGTDGGTGRDDAGEVVDGDNPDASTSQTSDDAGTSDGGDNGRQ